MFIKYLLKIPTLWFVEVPWKRKFHLTLEILHQLHLAFGL